MPPIMDIDSSDVNSPIEILEIPENLEIYDSDTGRRNQFTRRMDMEDESMDTEEKEETEEKEDAEAAHREEQEVSNVGV
ncbi:hypothetical protein K435DRAFT_964536 [Dendrothele bispora CBS 962.96]|uniref:Uncharacterized protein n=1 Tax=Dendrothele bispora (strain CBS 962.96) TaxID=1314807 RepID=A0A4V4HGK4_DENBC|nr:hypothetical protein K435DRAFT_964536 [Dendrothele bispora CBS 962.96]